MPVKKKPEHVAEPKPPRTLNKRDLEFFRKLITKQRDELRTKMEVLREAAMESTIKEATGDHSSYSFHMADLGTDAIEREKAFLFVSREGQYLEKLESALLRINDGMFGICRQCGKPVGKERLKAVPITTQCVQCKTHSS